MFVEFFLDFIGVKWFDFEKCLNLNYDWDVVFLRSLEINILI